MSTSAMHVAKTGLTAQQYKMQVIANNLANVNTTGFKRDRANFESLFYQIVKTAGAQTADDTALTSPLAVGTGVKVVSTQKLFTQGGLVSTDNSLDLAIDGPGFFQALLPDGRVGWLPQAVKKGNRIISQHKIDVIFSSAPPYTTHLIAKRLSLSNKIPWVADFRDPWTDRFYNYENKRWLIAQKLDKYLEDSVIKNADKCITVSRTISKYYKKPFEVIHNGYDEDDFSNIIPYKNKNIVISYLGN